MASNCTSAVDPRLFLAGTYVDDHDPAQPFELRGASTVVLVAPHTTLEGEWAVTHDLAGAAATPGAGDAGRVELRHEDPATQGRLWAMAAAPGFNNPGAGLAGGRTEAGGRLITRMADRMRLNAEALYSADAAGRTQRGGVLLAVERTLSPAWRGELGTRVSGESRESGKAEPLVASVRARMLGQWPTHPEWSGYGEFEQDTQEAARRMAAVGGEYRFNARGRAYVRHELASSLNGAWSLSSHEQRLATVAGIDADMAHDAHVFSEYRLADALAGRESQAAVGLRNIWRLRNGIRVGGSFERVNPLRWRAHRRGPEHGARRQRGLDRGPDLEGLSAHGAAHQPCFRPSAADHGGGGETRHLMDRARPPRADDRRTAQRRRPRCARGSRTRARLPRPKHAAARDGPLGRARSLGISCTPATRSRLCVINASRTSSASTPRAASRTVGVATSHGPGTHAGPQPGPDDGRRRAMAARSRPARLRGRDWDAGVSASIRSGRTFAERQTGLGL